MNGSLFTRFTERARQVIVLGQDEARGLKHDYVGAEHLLLGLLCEEHGLAARTLGSLGIEVGDVRERVRVIVGEGTEVLNGQLPFTPRAKKMLELALREALSLGHNYVGTEHVLLGLVRENEGVAAEILDDRGATAEKIRNEIIRTLATGSRKKVLITDPEPEPALALAWALHEIIAVLGPTTNCPHIKCEGCQAEMAEALRLAEEATA